MAMTSAWEPASRAEGIRELSRALEEQTPALARSLDGSSFTFTAPVSMPLQAGGYLSIATATGELYPEVVDAREEEGGVPSRLIKTDRREAGKEGTPWEMFARFTPRAAMTGSRSRWTTSRARVLVG